MMKRSAKSGRTPSICVNPSKLRSLLPDQIALIGQTNPAFRIHETRPISFPERQSQAVTNHQYAVHSADLSRQHNLPILESDRHADHGHCLSGLEFEAAV